MMRIAITPRLMPRGALTALICALCLGATTAVHADNDQPGFVIRTAFTELLNGVYCLNADVDLSMSNQAIDALENGVPLTVELQIEVTKHRSYMWNKNVATLAER